MTNDPALKLAEGALILGQKLDPIGFAFEIVERGKGSGGHFATGRFKKGDREIALWFRYSLGGVTYRKGDLERTHAEYMQALGRQKEAAYPDFPGEDLLASFRHLLADFDHCDSFLSGDGTRFVKLMRDYKHQPPTGFEGLG